MRTTNITEVRTVAINVSNQDDALVFYTDTLGFETRLDVPMTPITRWIEVAPPGVTTSIALNARDGTNDDVSDTGIRFSVPDAVAEHAAMRERGVTVGDVIRRDGVPPMYTFDDPDGNRFYVVEEIR
jgi:lactoylglutathione lyase